MKHVYSSVENTFYGSRGRSVSNDNEDKKSATLPTGSNASPRLEAFEFCESRQGDAKSYQNTMQTAIPTVQEFVLIQKTTGPFPLSDDFRQRVLRRFESGVDGVILESLRTGLKALDGLSERDICDTLICISFIKKMYPESAELWELVVNKAESWLLLQLSDKKVVKYLLYLADTRWRNEGEDAVQVKDVASVDEKIAKECCLCPGDCCCRYEGEDSVDVSHIPDDMTSQ